MAGDNDCRQLHTAVRQMSLELQAVHVWHAEIEHQAIGHRPIQRIQEFPAGTLGLGLKVDRP
jgi:hypothetical protein